MIEEMTYRGRLIKFSSISGKVIGTEKYSKTYIGSLGGGRDEAPALYSTAITHHNFWIMTADGKEKDIQLKGIDIPLREGQQVALISAESGEKSEWVALVNHNAQVVRRLISASSLVEELELDPASVKPIVVGLMIWIIVGWLGSWLWGFVFGGLLVWVRSAERRERIRLFGSGLSELIERAAGNLLRLKQQDTAGSFDTAA